jgi:hypothetical protein
MINFELYFERRERNPLRKRELERDQAPSYIDVYKSEFADVIKSKKFQDTYNLLKIRDPKAASKYLKQTEEKIKDKYLRTTVSKKDYVKLIIHGIEFNFRKDEKFLHTPTFVRIKNDLEEMVPKFLEHIKGILPLRRPKIIITDITEDVGYNPEDDVPAFYRDKVIFLDRSELKDHRLLVHEYAHFLADSIPAESYPMLQQEYEKMLDGYYRVIKKKKTYELQDTAEANFEKVRDKIAKKMGWPSQYLFNNPDEFFAEIITHWRDVPSNAITYKFKKAVKDVINRVSGNWDVNIPGEKIK